MSQASMLKRNKLSVIGVEISVSSFSPLLWQKSLIIINREEKEPEAQHPPKFHMLGKDAADPATAVRIPRSFSHLLFSDRGAAVM